jgi:hypothetical protein
VGGSLFGVSLGKRETSPKTLISIKEMVVVSRACHPCYRGSINRRITVQNGSGKM